MKLQIAIHKNGLINVDVLIQAACENEIELSDKDKLYLKTKLLENNNKVHFEDVIKDLALIAVHEKFDLDEDRLSQKENHQPTQNFQWVLRSNNRELLQHVKNQVGMFQNLTNLQKINKKPPLMQLHKKLLILKNQNDALQQPLLNLDDFKKRSQTPQHNNLLNGAQSMVDLQTTSLNEADSINNMIGSFSEDLQNVIRRIVGNKQIKKTNTGIDWKKQISAGSKKINIHKNIQNKIFIKAAISSDRIQQQKDKIRRYMKENNVDIMHLNEINNVFLDCDEDRKGQISKKQFIIQMAERNLQFPADFLFNLITDLQINPDDQSEEAQLNYENLKNIIEIYNNCPTFLKGDNNNSDNFKSNMDLNRDMTSSYDRIDKLFQYVHARIEEKFKDFRKAFRSFDKNFDGGLNFKEFITGMDGIGIKLKLTDYRLIFDAIDYDQEGEIGFSKFCLLNTDRRFDLQKLKQEYLRNQETRSMASSKGSKKPPLPFLQVKGEQANASEHSHKVHPLFGDGNIPKNKDMSSFTKSIQQGNQIQTYMQKRFLRSAQKEGLKTVKDMPEDHSFGQVYIRNHDMVAILTNSYQDELKRSTIEEIRQTLAQKKVLQSKPTHAQIIRDRVTKNRYMNNVGNLGRTGSVSIPRSSSATKINQKDLMMRGQTPVSMMSNSFNSKLHQL